MASTPDNHPDSLPPERSDDIERVSPGGDDGRTSVEDTSGDGNSVDSPGTYGGTAGTGGVNKAQEDLDR
ncbi:hypothetical protein [Sphingomonas jatrophae]|uniref:Uncharacterized protein n=1 Tax=Sphingomonas jatrophae TaxID=1166337 RepID=A0A1I6JUS8_9SPHN|nr:hypothetical protein [Sphingomonas jatrophae]SFR82765.1 hypothetical protein SAMN05192580_0917 [Sphingomonas jatrophae]